MYRPEKYKKDDKNFVFSFIKENPFATVIMNGNRLMATHLPVLVQGNEDNWQLYTHLANHNEQAALVKDGAEALIIFHGPHSYISSSWYKEKDISTWDYTAVHVNAKVKIQTREELENSLEELVKHFEKEQGSPLYYKEIPKKMLEDHLPLITGFWLEPVKVEGVAKLHQSYPKHDIEAVVDNLNSSGDSMKQKLGKAIKKENNIN
ncbi:PaiB family negative transcriptional regulator [Christiangramia gaetbulicola]|uniref:PaiB family negative transcriptional regulator n=1 Tax=Christiangramia gaetbulicola TaxID=703340 RepID=A0A2T6ALH8_9FLAO|nr:FMN-binding negative transcriptional regulator [Christiangramia gaetbulicola]PTX44669.1 PaiB family negative transcriptional regulator [Christiangramia gaetbulicola]